MAYSYDMDLFSDSLHWHAPAKKRKQYGKKTDGPTLAQPPGKRQTSGPDRQSHKHAHGHLQVIPPRRSRYPPTLAELLGDPPLDHNATTSGTLHGSKSRQDHAPNAAPIETEEETRSESAQLVEDLLMDPASLSPKSQRRMRKRRRKQLRLQAQANFFHQHGPERPGEFSRDLQHTMNTMSTDRTDPMRAVIFEQMITQADRKEQPNAPPIRVFPHLNEGSPEFSFVYTSRIIYPPHMQPLQSPGCDCSGGCCQSNMSCSCYRRQSLENARHNEPPGFAYDAQGLLRFRHDRKMAIWECNDMCGCGPECQNRRVGKGRPLPFDLVRTNQCGWGVRLGPLPNKKPGKKGKVKAGTFMALYTGELINIEEARRREKLYAQLSLSYLFDLDFASLGKNEHLKTFQEDGFCFLSESQIQSVLEATSSAPHQNAEHAPQTKLAKDTDSKQEEEEEYNHYEALWSVDAYHYGNVTRFFNHNCQPNCMLRCCYVNEGDLTKPLLGIFSIKTIYSGDEITLNYTGQLNLDWDHDDAESTERAIAEASERRTYLDALGERNCWCSAPRCTGNMFLAESDSEVEGDGRSDV